MEPEGRTGDARCGCAAEGAPASAGLLDVRPYGAFARGHRRDAASIPLEELPARVHELPSSRASVVVLEDDPARARAAAAFLEARGNTVTLGPATRDADGAPASLEEGPPRARLWRPAPFLTRALERIRQELPPGARALDVACGTGRDAVFLALAGLSVDAIDVLPDALERARDMALRSGVSVSTEARDVEADPSLPAARYDLVTVFRFLWRPLFPALAAAVRPGGFVVYETFHERTRETGRSPRSEAHLLRSGELAAAFPGFEPWIVEDAVEIPGDGRFTSRILARRPLA